MKEKLEALIARVEAADGPDRKLDGDIWLLIDPGAEPWLDDEMLRNYYAPGYTSSMDDAMTLVPSTWWWQITMAGFRSEPRYIANVYRPGFDQASYARSTPSEALTLAALRARLEDMK